MAEDTGAGTGSRADDGYNPRADAIRTIRAHVDKVESLREALDAAIRERDAAIKASAAVIMNPTGRTGWKRLGEEVGLGEGTLRQVLKEQIAAVKPARRRRG